MKNDDGIVQVVWSSSFRFDDLLSDNVCKELQTLTVPNININQRYELIIHNVSITNGADQINGFACS